jgi:hypothetical protein
MRFSRWPLPQAPPALGGAAVTPQRLVPRHLTARPRRAHARDRVQADQAVVANGRARSRPQVVEQTCCRPHPCVDGRGQGFPLRTNHLRVGLTSANVGDGLAFRPPAFQALDVPASGAFAFSCYCFPAGSGPARAFTTDLPDSGKAVRHGVTSRTNVTNSTKTPAVRVAEATCGRARTNAVFAVEPPYRFCCGQGGRGVPSPSTIRLPTIWSQTLMER